MTIATHRGSPSFPTVLGSISPSTRDEMDAAVQALQSHKDEWVTRTVRERIALLDRLIQDFAAIAPRWVAACLQAKSVAEDAPTASEEWAVPGPVTTRAGGQVVAQVFPQSTYDRLFFYGVTAEVWMEPGVTVEELPQTQATAYQAQQYEGKVALVLGAGNVSSIGPMDILYKLFVEDQVVLFKTNPVNAYLGSLIEES
ncbi:MAG: NAD-dependent aldehyde dehydrogenase, partial [Chloroflexi bacterium]